MYTNSPQLFPFLLVSQAMPIVPSPSPGSPVPGVASGSRAGHRRLQRLRGRRARATQFVDGLGRTRLGQADERCGYEKWPLGEPWEGKPKKMGWQTKNSNVLVWSHGIKGKAMGIKGKAMGLGYTTIRNTQFSVNGGSAMVVYRSLINREQLQGWSMNSAKLKEWFPERCIFRM